MGSARFLFSFLLAVLLFAGLCLAECMPAADGKSCVGSCGVSGEGCVPTVIRMDYNVFPPAYEVMSCDCLEQGGCHVMIGPLGLPECTGGCAAGWECSLVETDNGNNTSDFECQCVHADGWGDTCETAYEITSLPFYDTGDTCSFNNDYDEVCPYDGGTAADVVYSYTAESEMWVDISLCESGYDTKLYVYDGDCNGPAVGCNDDSCGENGYKSFIGGLKFEAGHTYYIVVDAFGTGCGEYVLIITEGLPSPGCSEGSLYGQRPAVKEGLEKVGLSDQDVNGGNYIVYDNIEDPNGLVCGIEWWGYDAVYDSGLEQWVACDNSESLFEIGFYADDKGTPGARIGLRTAFAEVSGTGYYSEGLELKHYSIANLIPCVSIGAGWISIQAGGGNDCWFSWAASAEGDGMCLQKLDGERSYFGQDRSFCLIGEGGLAENADLGDAPDSSNNANSVMEAYPGVQAGFATVYADSNLSVPVGPLHKRSGILAHLGAAVSIEEEADRGVDEDGINNIDPAGGVADSDGGDDGVVFPVSLPYCRWATIEYDVNVIVGPIDLYVNVWIDFNRDGDWDDVFECTGGQVNEWAVQDQLLMDIMPGLNRKETGAFLSWYDEGEAQEAVWMRITLSEEPWRGGQWRGVGGNGGSGTAGGYEFGETEDYLFVPDRGCEGSADLNCDRGVDFMDFCRFADQWLSLVP